MPSANKDIYIYFFSSIIYLSFFSWLIALIKTFSALLKRSGESGKKQYHCLILVISLKLEFLIIKFDATCGVFFFFSEILNHIEVAPLYS